VSNLRLWRPRRRRSPPIFRHEGHACALRSWRRFSWNRWNHGEGLTRGTGNLPPGMLFITFQALPAMRTVKFKLAHAVFITNRPDYRWKWRTRPAFYSLTYFSIRHSKPPISTLCWNCNFSDGCGVDSDKGLTKTSLPPGLSTFAAARKRSSINRRISGTGTRIPMGGLVMIKVTVPAPKTRLEAMSRKSPRINFAGTEFAFAAAKLVCAMLTACSLKSVP